MAKIAIEDLSGASTPVTANPYDGLINAVDGDPVRTDPDSWSSRPNAGFRRNSKNATNSTESPEMVNKKQRS